MKALIYKELKLAMHPICYIFIIVFPLMAFIPSYPLAIGFIYVLSCYPILFLGANKGQQSNDLLFTALLPVRKKDIVLARIITVLIMQFVFTFLLLLVAPFGGQLTAAVEADAIASGVAYEGVPGLQHESILTVVSIAIICFSFADLVFFSVYYKNGKSIVLSSLLTIFGFMILVCGLTILLPLISPFDAFFAMIDGSVLAKFIMIMCSVLISAFVHYITYKVASKELERVDF